MLAVPAQNTGSIWSLAGRTLDEIPRGREVGAIESALEQTDGNKSRAALQGPLGGQLVPFVTGCKTRHGLIRGAARAAAIRPNYLPMLRQLDLGLCG